jgi:predicted phosphoribosyltransferase
MGAISSGGTMVLNRDVIGAFGISRPELDRVARAELAELRRQERAHPEGRPRLEVAGKTVILVDDGLATGSTMQAAVAALRAAGPHELVVAAPVASAPACAELEGQADSVVCAATPDPFYAVGVWYQDFSPTPDDEVRHLLAEAAAVTPVS